MLNPDGDQVAVKGTMMSTEVSVEHVVPASALVEGNHTVRLEVRDDVGNAAVPVETMVMGVIFRLQFFLGSGIPESGEISKTSLEGSACY